MTTKFASFLLAVAFAAACGNDSGGGPGGLTASQIPVAHTPPGGYGSDFPAPILDRCTEPLVAGAPDLRGMWLVVGVEVNGAPAPADHPAFGQFQRVEQCGDRLVVTEHLHDHDDHHGHSH